MTGEPVQKSALGTERVCDVCGETWAAPPNPIDGKATCHTCRIRLRNAQPIQQSAFEAGDSAMTEGLQAKEGPTRHLIVEEQRLGRLLERGKMRARKNVLDMADHIDAIIDSAIADAYYEGLRDGFMQGCVAEARARNGE